MVALRQQDSFAPKPGQKQISPRYLEEAKALYELLQDGAPGGGFHVQRGPWLRDAVTRMPLPWSHTKGWKPAREVVRVDDQVEYLDRTLNSWVLAQMLRGTYDVAWQAPSWTSLIILDIDRRFKVGKAPTAYDEADADMDLSLRLAAVWDAFGFDSEHQPVVLRSPGGGYHVYIPLEKPRPAAQLRRTVHRFLVSRGIEVRAGRVEIFPAGQRLRAPCGRGMALLVPQQPDEADDLRLELRHAQWTERGGCPALVRDISALARGFVSAVQAARRPLNDWLSDAAQTYDKTWGPWGVRSKKSTTGYSGVTALSQHSWRSSSPHGSAGASTSAGPELLYGKEFRSYVAGLLEQGLTFEGQRHDALLKLAFYWNRTVGISRNEFESELHAWLERFEHCSKDRRENPAQFTKQSLREALHYFDTLDAESDGHKRARGEGHLAAADLAMLAMLDERVQPECEAILRHLRGQAEAGGVVPESVNLSSNVLQRLCGERRVAELVDGVTRRRRATVMAVEELVRAGVLLLHQNHLAGRHGRMYTCWYHFGSGALPSRSGDAVVLATRVVNEGRLEALSRDGSAALRLVVTSVRVAENAAQSGAYRPWWLALYQRGFTPVEFAVGDTAGVICGPWSVGRKLPIEIAFEVPLDASVLEAQAAEKQQQRLSAPATRTYQPPERRGSSPRARLAISGQQLALLPDDADRGIGNAIGQAWQAHCGRFDE